MLSNTTTWPVFFQYHNLLRADLDTFPTPLLRDDWPDDLQINAMAGYATQKSRAMLARVGEEAGVFYDGISNIASTYWGDAVSVVKSASSGGGATDNCGQEHGGGEIVHLEFGHVLRSRERW